MTIGSVIYAGTPSAGKFEATGPKVSSNTVLLDPTCAVDCAGQLMLGSNGSTGKFAVIRLRDSNARLAKVQAVSGSFALVGATPFLQAVAAGAPLVAIWANTQVETSSFFVKQSSDIRTVDQFIGKRLAIAPNARITLDAIMIRNSLPRSQVTVLVGTDPFNAVQSGQADIAFGDVFEFMRRSTDGSVSLREISLSSLGVHFPGDVIVTSDDTVASHPELVDRFVEDCAFGWAEVFDDSLAASNAVARSFPDFRPPFATEALIRQRIFVSPFGSRPGELQAYLFRELADALHGDGQIKTELDFSHILNTAFVDKHYREEMHRRKSLTSTRTLLAD